VGGSENVRFFGTEIRMQTWRWTELPQMLEVTTIGSHAGSQVLTQHLHSHLVYRCKLSRIERNVKLGNYIREKYVF